MDSKIRIFGQGQGQSPAQNKYAREHCHFTSCTMIVHESDHASYSEQPGGYRLIWMIPACDVHVASMCTGPADICSHPRKDRCTKLPMGTDLLECWVCSGATCTCGCDTGLMFVNMHKQPWHHACVWHRDPCPHTGRAEHIPSGSLIAKRVHRGCSE